MWKYLPDVILGTTLLAMPVGAQPHAGAAAAVKQARRKEAYRIDDRAVTRSEFDAFKAKLKGQEKWTCEKTTYGGTVHYLARNSRGTWFRVNLETGGGEEFPSSITPASPPEPR